MKNNLIEIIDPGVLSTIQDLGRFGYQKYGVPVSGAMDQFAYRIGNILVNNDQNSPSIETTVFGLKLKFLKDTVFSITGANLSPTINQKSVPMWQSIVANQNDTLELHSPLDGCRSYISFEGGISVPETLGSKSTYANSNFAGLNGRSLITGDILTNHKTFEPSKYVQRRLPPKILPPTYDHDHQIRVILGPQQRSFTAQGIETFQNSEYIVSDQSNRIGYRLEGKKIEHFGSSDILSDGTMMGSIQIPGNGNPIILMSDRGVTGGYPKIATIISSDISKIAQALPGDKIKFLVISNREAESILIETENLIQKIYENSSKSLNERLNILINDISFEVIDEENELITTKESFDPIDIEMIAARVKTTHDEHDFNIEIRRQSE